MEQRDKEILEHNLNALRDIQLELEHLVVKIQQVRSQLICDAFADIELDTNEEKTSRLFMPEKTKFLGRSLEE